MECKSIVNFQIKNQSQDEMSICKITLENPYKVIEIHEF